MKFHRNSESFVYQSQEISSSTIEVYDKHGEIIRDKNKFKDYCLALCEQKIRVGFLDWKAVPDSIKDNTWEILQKDLQLEPNQKENALKQMGVQWKTLRDQQFILASKDKVPQQGRIRVKEACEIAENGEGLGRIETVHDNPSVDATKGILTEIPSSRDQTTQSYREMVKGKKSRGQTSTKIKDIWKNKIDHFRTHGFT